MKRHLFSLAVVLALSLPVGATQLSLTGAGIGGASGCSTAYDNWSSTNSSTVPGKAATVTVVTSAQTTPSNVTGSFATVKPTSDLQVVEFIATTVTSGGGVGLCKSGESTANFLGGTANCYGYSAADGIFHNGGNITCTSVACPNYTTGDKIGIVYGFASFWLVKNGSPLNGASFAEMAAGTTTHAVVTGLTGSWVPAGGNASAGSSVQTTNLGTSSFALPSGYCLWNTGP